MGFFHTGYNENFYLTTGRISFSLIGVGEWGLIVFWTGGEDASHSGGLKDEVRTPQTQTSSQCPSHPPGPNQTISFTSVFCASQEPFPFSEPAGVLKTPKKCSGVRGSWKLSGQDKYVQTIHTCYILFNLLPRFVDLLLGLV